MKTLTFRHSAAAACAFLTAVVSVGCGSAPTGVTGSASVSHTASKSETGSPTSSSATGSVPTSTPTPTRPSARNGTNYKACSDGICEIAVSKPVTIKLSDSPLNLRSFRVKKVKAGEVHLSFRSPSGATLTAIAKKGCTAALYNDNTQAWIVQRCSNRDSLSLSDHQMVTVKDITDGTAVLNLKI